MDPKEILANNLRKLLESKGVTQTQMAHKLGYPEMTVSNWMKAKTYPRVDRVQEMADFFGVYRSDITDDKSEHQMSTFTSYSYYPEPISAGSPNSIEAITDCEKISVPDRLMGKYAGNESIYITRTNGNSMNNIIPDSSLIAVKPVTLSELKNGDIVVYKHNQEYAVKRFFQNDNQLIFKPDSDQEHFVDNVIDLNEANDLEIKGKVVLYIVELD